LLEPVVLDFIPPDTPFDLLTQLLPTLLAAGQPVYGLKLPMQWFSLSQLTDYYQVMQLALRGKLNYLPLPGRELAPGLRVGLNTLLDLKYTTIVPPVFLGGGVTIEPGCTLIGPSWIGPGCIIESGAHVEKSLVFEHTRVGFTANVRNLMLSGSCAVDSAGTVLDLVRSEMEWAVTDARQPRPELKFDHLLIQHEQLLREQHRSFFDILPQ
jgi:mannose-1-phosphate guanylyltransferase